MSVLIKNGRIVTAGADYIADIFVEGESISAIGKNLAVSADKTIDATGKLVFPGGIDPHVHLDLPFMGTYSSDNYETGTRAALFGGTTSVIDFVIQSQGHSMHSAVEEWHKKADGNAFGDYGFHIAVTDFNPDSRAEINDLIKYGITSFKVFMAYKGALMIDDEQMIGIMNEVKQHDGMVSVHATNGDMIDFLVKKHQAEGKLTPHYHYLSQPEITEIEASGRFIDIANYTGVTCLIVHMTSGGALDKVRDATKRNQKVFVETCPQYLLLDASVYEKENFEGAKWVMSPPIREKKDQAALWAGLNQGLINFVGTDHCPFFMEQKRMGQDDFTKIPNGAPGIEHRLELLYSEGVRKGRISLNKFVEITSTNVAKIFGMYPNKGTLAIGADADIVIFDPEEQHTISAKTHHHNCDYSSYEGWDVTGKCKTVLVRGVVAIENNEVKIEKGFGQFVKRGPTSLVI
ncbi:MAG: dihydropyrimidinase [Calditrichaeota bacterium]|nr:MAG: dihydropyrimidinase [Calditrichota bacterium]